MSEGTTPRAGRVWEVMQRFVLLGSVFGVAAGGLTATVQHSDDVVDVLAFIRNKVGPTEASVAAAPPSAAEPELTPAPAPPVSTLGPLHLARVRVVDVTSLEDGGGMWRGAVEWDFALRDVLTGMPLELESRSYRGEGPAESFGAEHLFTQGLDDELTLMIDGWFHDRLGRRELRIRDLVHVKLDAPVTPIRVRAIQGADWGAFDIRLELVESPRPHTAKK